MTEGFTVAATLTARDWLLRPQTAEASIEVLSSSSAAAKTARTRNRRMKIKRKKGSKAVAEKSHTKEHLDESRLLRTAMESRDSAVTFLKC